MNAAEFNALYEVGVPVFAYPGARPEDFPKATRLVTRTRSKASVLGGHTDVVWVHGHSASIALSHVDVVSEAAFQEALLADTVKREGALPMPAGPARSELQQVTDEIARFGIYGAAVPAAKALVKRADELVTENEQLQARVDEVERRYTFDTAELKRRIAELEKDSRTLAALHTAGVDNWEGYDDAIKGVA